MAGPVRPAALRVVALWSWTCVLATGACGGGNGAPAAAGPDASGSSGGASGGTGGVTGSGGNGSGGNAVDAVASADSAGNDVAPAGVDATTADAGAGGTSATCTPCADYAPATQTGAVTNATLNQLSGIAVSHRNPEVLFVHNDRTATVFWAVSPAGALLATFNYTGVTVRDVEDIAVGACPTGSCVYLADIGGNLAPRPDYTIVRVPEPAVASNGSAAPVSVAAEKLVFTYPDGALHNAESLLIDPRTGTLYIIDKVAAGAHSSAYRLPAGFGGTPVVALKVAELPVPMANDTPATAADAHPCGTGFILRTNNTAYEFRIAAGAPFEDAFKATPVAVPVGQEQQGEGVSYQPDGRGFYTTTEGDMPPLHHTVCR